jgi:predicted RNA methylase
MAENSAPPSAENKPWRQAIKTMPGLQYVGQLNVALESWWFDFRHGVDTSLQLEEQNRRGWRTDKVNFYYVPTRPKWARRALRQVPANVRRECTFVDFGSGKGRVLLMAAQLGFRRLYGIELRKELHEQACRNFERFRHAAGCKMESLNIDAVNYEFPRENLVLFFFNPFSGEVMEKVLANLAASLDRDFRDIWVILHGSVCAHLADATPQLELQVAHHGYRIYRSSGCGAK